MTTYTYLLELIDRMNDPSDLKAGGGYDSSKTISWKALREAEKIDNKGFIPPLISFIDTEKDKKKRDKAYFLLGHIAKNTNDLTALNYLITRVDMETDKYILGALLDRISNINKPPGTNLNPLINATKNDQWLIRHSAIQSLKYSMDTVAESTLIEIIDRSIEPSDLTCANATLNKIGTPGAIPFLEKHLTSRKRDVKLSAKLAIEEIRKRHHSE